MKWIYILTALMFSAAAMIPLHGQNLTRAQYIEKYKDIAIRQMNRHKIPASITLAQGCLESDNGNSSLARKANNHFGIKCHKGWLGGRYKHDDDSKGECFRRYDSAAESYADHSNFLTNRPRYASLFDLEITDYKAWAHGLKAAGYATDPKYAQLLINIIEDYKLYQYDIPDALHKAKSDLKEAKKKARQEKKLRKLEKKAAKAAGKSAKADARLKKYRDAAGAALPEQHSPVNVPVTQAPAQEKPAPVGHPEVCLYTIQAGDTLYSLARKNGTTVDDILRFNPGLKATELKIGTQIRIR